ncbi:hypothetical protein TNCV_367391 [Trichonephila clavipes]|nr:hypothetical protein TNCV_367391 [Trichonephila clavipes]
MVNSVFGVTQVSRPLTGGEYGRVSRDTVSKLMGTYTQLVNAKQNGGRKEKLNVKDRRLLKEIVMPRKQTTATKGTVVLNQYLDSPVSLIIVRSHLHKLNIYCRTEFPSHLS